MNPLKKSLLLLLLMALSTLLYAADPAPTPSHPAGDAEKPAWFKESFLDLREDLAEATQAQKRLMLYFYQEGCPYCTRLIQTNFAQHEIATKAQRHFEAIAINLWGDREVTDLKGKIRSEKEFAVALKVQFTPTLIFLDEQGEVAYRVNGYYPPHQLNRLLDYLAEKREQQLPFRTYLEQHAPQAASGQLHRQPDYLTPEQGFQRTPNSKPLLVLVEQAECSSCDELHREGLVRPEVKALLPQLDIGFLDLRASSTKFTDPKGVPVTVGEWLKQHSIHYTPTLLFFNNAGEEIFRVEAYLRPFHLISALEYVTSGAYLTQPEFQRYIDARADRLRGQGHRVELW